MFLLSEIKIVFDDLKNYFDFNKTTKTCALCKNNLPLKIYTTCEGCGQHFCYSHKPLFANGFCPLCSERFKQFAQPLKTSNTIEFLKKIF